MKTTIVCVLLLCAAPFVNAAPHANHSRIVRVTIPAVQEIKAASSIVAGLRTQYPGYADTLLLDPRFRFDMRVVTGPVPLMYPAQPPAVYPKRNFALTDYAIRSCRQYSERNAGQFDVIERQFKTSNKAVKREEVIATLDAENGCGKVSLGVHPIAPTYFTLATFKPRVVRRGWAHTELDAFFSLASSTHKLPDPGMWRDPLSLLGSYRGGFGLPQDLPSSYKMTAMHFDGTKCVSFRESRIPPNVFEDRDANCSIANYHARSGKSGYLRFLRYNHSSGYAHLCQKVARIFSAIVASHRVRAAVK